MSDSGAASTRDEVLLYIPVDGEKLFAMVTAKPGQDGRLGLVFAGAGHMFSAQRNRLPVRLCRRLASRGIRSLRFDYLGTGDSTGPPPAIYRLDRPFLEQTVAAAQALEAQGVGAYVLAGSCFGARSALAAAVRLERTVGVVMIAPPIGDADSSEGSMVSHLGSGMKLRTYVGRGLVQVLRGIFRERLLRKYARRAKVGISLAFRAARARRPRLRRSGPQDAWISQDFTSSVSALTARGVPLLLVYGNDDPHFTHFRHASKHGVLADVLLGTDDLIEVRTIPGQVEGFATIQAQQEVLDIVEDWVVRRARHLEAPKTSSAMS